ncbi:hypothetical protein XENOCAPTIV_007012 [Xenoophorus captivus]|uniref:Uncharacterized protein n=1 Tax=Xenoophorus captivus TaxID=1517983 RepID=A0ABV0RY43_9TELE
MEGARRAATGGIHPDRVGCADSHLPPSFSRRENLMSRSAAPSYDAFLYTHSQPELSIFSDGFSPNHFPIHFKPKNTVTETYTSSG